MSSPASATYPAAGFEESPASLSRADTHEDVTPSEIAVGVIIGRSSEYFDFFVFGIACVLVFPSFLFPFLSRLDGTLMAFALLAVAFVVRPVGTAISMAIQRRWGRGTKLTIALFLLGVCTVGMAFLPGYKDAGLTAVVALLILRIGQGLALGGSWDGLPSLLAMSAPKERRGWFAMIGQLGAPVGFVLAAGLFAYLYSSLSVQEFLAWGWRYPFFVAFAVNVVALFARLRLVVGQSYAELLQERELQPVPVSRVIRDEGSNVVLGAFAALASFALFHLVTVFPLSWIALQGSQPVTEVLGVQVIGAFLAAVLVLDLAFPPPLTRAHINSVLVTDRHGKPLRQSRTVSSRTPKACAIRALVQPSSVRSSARARSASARSAPCARTFNAAFCSSVAVTGDLPAMTSLRQTMRKLNHNHNPLASPREPA